LLVLNERHKDAKHTAIGVWTNCFSTAAMMAVTERSKKVATSRLLLFLKKGEEKKTGQQDVAKNI
jgi:hypothetical protein